MTSARIDKASLPLDQPRRTPAHPTKSHVVKTRVDGKERIIRFGEQGAETAGKPKAGESERMKAKRASFKARHAKNIAKGKTSPAYWADKVKWAEGGAVRKPVAPSEVIAELMGKVKRGQATQQRSDEELESVRKMMSSSRLGSARRSPLSMLRAEDSTTPVSPSPPSESAGPVAGAGTAQAIPVTAPQPTSSAAVNTPARDNPYYAEAAQLAEKYGLPVNVFVSLVNQESRFNPEARSPKGALGLTQLMPATAKELGVDPTDPLQNLEGGARYLRQQIDRFGSLPLALAAYNAGPGNVRKYGGVPPFKETQNYVAAVLKGAGEEPQNYAGGGLVSKLAKRAAKAAEDVSEQKMLQGFYRGYAGDYDAARAGADAGEVFVSPQKPVGEYYGRKRAAQTGEEPHLEMVLADPFAGEKYGHAVPMGPLNRSGVGQTMARKFDPDEIEQIIKLFNEGGAVKAYAEGGRVEAEMKPTPQNRVLGYAAGKLKDLSDLASEYALPESIPLIGGTSVAEIFGLPGASREVERWSYGNYPMRVNPYAGRTASYLPETKPGRQQDLGDTLLLGTDLTGIGSLAGKYAVKGGMAAGRAGEQLAERVVPSVIERGGLGAEMLEGLAGGSRSQVIKPKGGNWLSGSLDAAVEPLRPFGPRHRDEALILGGDFARMADTPEGVTQMQRNEVTDKWLDTKLKKYIQNELGTPEDPVRALAERGVLHVDPEQVGINRYRAPNVRQKLGTEQMGKSEAARAWEDASDTSLLTSPASEYLRVDDSYGKQVVDSILEANPWLAKVPPETKVYEPGARMNRALGFDHLVDEMNNAMRPDSDLPDRLRIDPKKLDKMTVPQMVERVSEINAWRAEQKIAANAEKAMNPATQLVKEYPEQGYKWVELRQPEKPEGWTAPERYEIKQPIPSSETLAIFDKERGQYVTTGLKSEQQAIDHLYKMNTKQALEDALKYEGDVMGHCVGGYCPDVAEGRTRIYSLRDKKGEPHVTIEVRPGPRIFDTGTPEGRPGPENIVQIKGKQNRAPKEEYLPFVQDFVKGGKWSEVGDLENTGLVKFRDQYASPTDFEYNLDGTWKNLADVAKERFPDQPRSQHYFIQGAVYATDDYIRPAAPKSGYATGGLVSAYNPADIDALVNQVLEGAYV